MHAALIEGTGWLHRHYFGNGSNAEAALVSYATALWEAVTSPVTEIAVAFDLPARTFRHDILPTYKGHRAARPDDLKDLLRRGRDLTEAMGIVTLSAEGFEADDLIASAVAALAGRSQVTILSNDKDFYQLVDDGAGVAMLSRMSGETTRYDEAAVVAKIGVRPDQVADLLAIAGDVADGVPGIDGVGEKGAASVLARCRSLELILSARWGLPPRLQKVVDAIQRHAVEVLTYRQLTTLARTAPVPASLARGAMDRWELGALLKNGGDLLNRIRESQR